MHRTTDLRLTAGPEQGTALHLTSVDAGLLDGAWLLLPEVPHVAGDDAPNLAVALDYARFYGIRTAAIFYDLIPLRQPGYEGMSEPTRSTPARLWQPTSC